MTHRLLSLQGMVMVFAVATLLSIFASASTAHAAMWTGRGEKQGYFDKSDTADSISSECTRGPVLYNDCYNATPAIPTSVNTGAELYNYLHNRYDNPKGNGGKWDKTGVSFIVNTMLGNDPGQGVRNITAGMWSDLKQRLESSSLTIEIDKSLDPSNYGHDTYYQHNDNDVAYYDGGNADAGRAMVFKSGGNTRYILMYACGNPVGNYSGLLQPPQWTISTSTTASKTNTTTTPALAANEIIPGDTVTWKGIVKNNGPDPTDASVSTRFNKSNGWGGTAGSRTIGSGFKDGATSQDTFAYKAVDTDLGKTLCVSTWAQPHAWNDSSPTESAAVCYKVVYRYELHPTVAAGNTSVEAGATSNITVQLGVQNDGPTVSVPNTVWQLTRCTYPGLPPASTADATNTQSNNAMFGGSCANVPGQGGTRQFGKGSTDLGTITADTSTVPAGTRICYVMSVTPASATDTRVRHSVLTCIAVLKYPKLQALGADVRANNVQTHTSANIGGKFYGSWSQYGIFGIGGVSGMASASSLAGGSTTNSAADQRALTFANTPSLGGFYSTPPAPDAYFNAYYDASKATASPTMYGAVANGTQAVISVSGDLTISQNITYTGSYADASQIPRVIYVVNGNIKIDPTVTRIDAWLIAKGTLYTCSTHLSKAQQLTTGQCDMQLTFNGPVNVGDSLLGRTFGADAGSGNPADAAEVFNLAPSNYLSTYSASISSSNIQTVYEKELPPRW